MQTRTKIVCTIGPAVNSANMIRQLLRAGMNVARLNFSHGTHKQHAATIKLLKAARKESGAPLAIMLDTKGPEVRVGSLDKEIVLKKRDRLWLLKKRDASKVHATIMPPHILDSLKEGMEVLLDDGYLITRVIRVTQEGAEVEVEHGGLLKSSKGVNFPGLEIDLPAMTKKDIEDIKFGCAEGVDMIAASFVRSADHVVQIKRLVAAEGYPDIWVLAKIENQQGVENFESIVQVSDGIMVARGDLGVELPLTEVPRLQKMMIQNSYLVGKPCITATQMLESMISNPRPTRAEASDVANAIYDSTSAVMLSGETAMGEHPIDTVETMRAIVRETEKDFDYKAFFNQTTERLYPDVPSAVATASIKTAYSAGAKAIFAFTASGSTARLLSRLRPKMPIIALTPREKVYHQLSLLWGVYPILCEELSDIGRATEQISAFALDEGIVEFGDLVVITAGTPFGRAGTTNMMIVDSIGDVLVRSQEALGHKIYGKIALFPTLDQDPSSVHGKIIVLEECHEKYLPFLEHSIGVILQNHPDDTRSATYLKKVARKSDLTILIRADGAGEVLRDEQLVTVDPDQLLVFKGVV